MQTRHQLALLAAGILVGAQISIAAIGLSNPDAEQWMDTLPPEDQVVDADSASVPDDVLAENGATNELAQAPVAAREPWFLEALPPEPVYPWERTRPWGSDEPVLLPKLAAYLDRTAHLRLTGASGQIFPESADDNNKPMLPAVIAYFERLEATRLAALAPRTDAADRIAEGPAQEVGPF